MSAEKPVRLQFNSRGAWRDVLQFDAAQALQCDEVMAAAEQLARAAGVGAMRVVMEDSPHPRSPEVLLTWSANSGWGKR